MVGNTNRVEIVVVHERSVAVLAVEVLVLLVLLLLRLVGKRVVAEVAVVGEVIRGSHMLDARIFRVEPALASIALEVGSAVACGSAVVFTSLPSGGKLSAAAAAFEVVEASRHCGRWW